MCSHQPYYYVLTSKDKSRATKGEDLPFLWSILFHHPCSLQVWCSPISNRTIEALAAVVRTSWKNDTGSHRQPSINAMHKDIICEANKANWNGLRKLRAWDCREARDCQSPESYHYLLLRSEVTEFSLFSMGLGLQVSSHLRLQE